MAAKTCTSTQCEHKYDNPAVPATLTDTSGYPWCADCSKRCELMNWGKARSWPEVRATGQRGRYATGEGEWNWFVSIAMGNQDSINAFHREIFGQEKVG